MLSYFLSIGQTFDLVVNIDGFNEVALGSLNERRGLDLSMPSVMHLEPLRNLVDRSTLTPDRLESLAAIGRYRRRLNALAERINGNPVAAVHVALDVYYRSLQARYRAERVAFDQLPSNLSWRSLISATPPLRARDDAMVFEDIVANWEASSRLMHEILAARGVPYVEFLQPNQYASDRVFGRDEAAVAFNDASPFKPGAQTGYPLLVEAIESGRLRRNGVRLFNGRGIFDAEPQPVYVDDCCHYTLRGYEILADFIAASVPGSDGPWSTAAR